VNHMGIDFAGRARGRAGFEMIRSEAITLVEPNPWAHRRVLSKASRPPNAALRAWAALSYPSILNSLAHLLDTQSYWREAAQSGPAPLVSLSAADCPTLNALRPRWDGEDRLLLESVRDLSDGESSACVQVGWPRPRPQSWRLSHTLTNIVFRATQRRSELAHFLPPEVFLREAWTSFGTPRGEEGDRSEVQLVASADPAPRRFGGPSPQAAYSWSASAGLMCRGIASAWVDGTSGAG